MTRRLLPLALVLLAGCGTSTSFSIDRATLQSAAASYFPLSSDKLGPPRKPVHVALSDPEVLLEAGANRIGLRIRIVVEPDDKGPLPPSKPAGPLTGTVMARGVLSYRPKEGAFYYSQPTIDELSFPQLPAQFEAPVRELTEALLAQYVQAKPIYTLSGDTKSQAARLVLKSVTVRDGKLLVELGR